MTRLSSIEMHEKRGIDLTKLGKSTAAILKPFDMNGDNWLGAKEIVKGAAAMTETRKENSRQKQIIYFLLIGYTILVGTISGLVYGMLKLTQETRIGSGNTMMSNSKNPEPISINTNMINATLGMVPFLPSHIISKIDRFSFSNDETELYRMVQSIDVIPEKSFVITSTAGDTLVWDSNVHNELMQITLIDGTMLEKHVGCAECSAINFARNNEVDEALQLFIKFLDTIDGGNNRRFLGTGGCHGSNNWDRRGSDDDDED